MGGGYKERNGSTCVCRSPFVRCALSLHEWEARPCCLEGLQKAFAVRQTPFV